MKYYPILKLRSSEISALNEMKRNDFEPIIEVDNNAEPKALDYLKDFKRDYYFDIKNKNDLLDIAKVGSFFPVLGIDRDYYYNFSCIELARKAGKALIRVKQKDFKNKEQILSLIKATGLKDENIKVMLDLETIHNNIDEIYDEIVSTLPFFNNIIIAGNSVPSTTAGIKNNSYKEIDRKEWFLYQALKEANANLAFGDYGVRHHESIGYDNNFIPRVDVKLIYTTDTGFMIFRGEQANAKGKNGSKSIIPICKQIAEIEDFDKSYSYGDAKIYEIAMQPTDGKELKTGNSGEWIKIGHTHHITLLCDLLSN